MGLHRWKNNEADGVVNGVIVLKKGDELVWDYTAWGTDCGAAKIYFNGLTLAQKLALAGVTRAMPSPPAGYYYKEEACGGSTTPTNPSGPTDPGTPTNDLEEDIVYTGRNMSDSPSNNPSVMSIAYTFIGNGQFTVKVSGNDLANLWICYNTMGYLNVAAIEGRTYRCGVPHLFLGYIMPGVPDDSRRSDSTLNAHQILSVF